VGYLLQAVIGTERVLREWAGPIPEADICSLGQHVSLVPMTDELFVAVTLPGAPEPDGFWKAPAGLGQALTACSASGPVAYVEAEYFGGVGTQSAQVWDGGNTVLGVLRLAEGERFPAGGSPISRALRRLGVAKGDHVDEFDAVALGRHRDTDDWPAPVTG
jgi:hypothetical protein